MCQVVQWQMALFPVMGLYRGSIFIVAIPTTMVLVTSIYAVLEQYQKVSVIKVHSFLVTRLRNKNITQQYFKKLVC